AASPAVCDNLVFHRRAALDRLGERLLDANRTIGQPDKLTTIFGHKVTKSYRGKLQTEIENMHLPNPVIRSHYRNGFIKQTLIPLTQVMVAVGPADALASAGGR